MLAKSNDSHLQYKKINAEYFFLYQRWQEMLETRTLDMYQYNILNSCVACIELKDVIGKTLLGLFTSKQNIEDVKAEALAILKNDDIMEKYSKPLRNTLLRILGTKIDSKPKNNEALEDKNSSYYITLNRLKYQLIAPIRELQSVYLNNLLRGLKEDVDAADYSKTELHMSMIVSQCISQGWSAKGLFLLSSYFEGEACSNDKWLKFTNALSAVATKDFKVFYGIKLETRAGVTPADVRGIITSLGLDLKTGSEIANEFSTLTNLHSKLKSKGSYISLCVEAYDLHSAALTAINLLNKKISVATFYNTISPWVASSPQIVVYDSVKNIAESLSMTDVFKTYDYIDSNNSIFKDTNKILNDPQKSAIMNRLHAAFSYTNLSRSSYFQETKYISLWIAIESVMRTGQFPDIISHIKFVLPEILCVRYIYRIIRNFSEDCIRCGMTSNADLSLRMDMLNKKQLSKELIAIFRNPEQYVVLKDQCKGHQLLNYRCEEIHAILNDAGAIGDKLEHYAKKIRWHIQRLYRIRNEITHSAFQENRSLVIYIEHLYTYLAQLMSEVVYYVEHKNSESVEEAFATISESYYTYLDLIKEGRMPINELLPDGVIEFIY